MVSIALVLSMVLSFSSCSSSSNAMNEENVKATVEIVETALKEFDTKTLKKYVDSTTLSYILNFADKHEQFVTLGKAIFKDMEIEIKEINIDQRKVTIAVTNRELSFPAKLFASDLLAQNSKLSLLSKLEDDDFLTESLTKLLDLIDSSKTTATITVDLRIKQEKKNLVLSFDEEAENAVSGGALTAITSITP